MKKKILIAILILFGMSLAAPCSATIGIGIAPAQMTISDAFRGGTYERNLFVFNNGDEEGNFTLSVEGEMSNWTSFYDISRPEIQVTEFSIPAKSRVEVIVRFTIPEDIPTGSYNSTIYAASVPEKLPPQPGGVLYPTIRAGSKVLIQVTGTQILKGTVKSIMTSDTEIGYPVKIKVEFQNEGNVIAKPKIAVDIMRNGKHVDSFVHSETGIKPGKTDTITVLWNTTGREAGDYLANVTVSLDGELLASKMLSFKILPLGTLTRRGELLDLTIEGEPLVNRVIKIVANFENTGEIDTMAKFKGEIIREGKLLDVLESDEMFVEAGKSGKLTSYYKIVESGNYSIKGRILYAGKETEEKEVSFNVPEVKSEVPVKKGIPGFEAVLAITAIILLFIIRRTRKYER
jgi:hypothetical protein